MQQSPREEIFATFWEHLDELRSILIRSLIVICAGIAIAFWFYPTIFGFLKKPLNEQFFELENQSLQHFQLKEERIVNTGDRHTFYTLSSKELIVSTENAIALSKNKYQIAPQGYIDIQKLIPSNELLILGPSQGMLVAFKVSFWVGLVLSSPLWVYFILHFFRPALREKERKLLPSFLIFSTLFVISGILFAYYITIPAANQYLYDFNNGLGTNFWSLDSYINFSFSLMLANALAFELCVILFLLVHYELLTAEFLKSKRKHVIVGSLILAALLTPPDVLSQILVAIPLWIFYECAILYANLRRKKLIACGIHK